jgi:hypothetical protein
MKKHILIITAVIISMTLNACTINLDGESLGNKTIKGNGNIVTRNFDVSAFDEISTSLSATVNFTISDAYTCTFSVDENIFDYLDIRVEDQELLMGKKKEHKNTNLRATQFVVDVTAPSLEQINLAGSGTFNALSPMEVKKLEANVAGSGDIIFKETVTVDKAELNVAGSGDMVCDELVADELDTNVAGSGDVKITIGKVRKAEASVAGSGDIVLTCDIENLDANIAGSGDIKARVNGRLTYGIFGSGDIGYYGNPVVEGDKVGRAGLHRLGD